MNFACRQGAGSATLDRVAQFSARLQAHITRLLNGNTYAPDAVGEGSPISKREAPVADRRRFRPMWLGLYAGQKALAAFNPSEWHGR